ncbi:unnamed protein product [Phyllotreta striolata]|uniref:BPTI/Kunitz inhibitor domain-containing protein n=1 Tax=Phyllotreta striolata TaxID=444603 RepID=A0A9N9TV18_PHYSR|nr:unnamed protein product [Phyllotreta striolata]
MHLKAHSSKNVLLKMYSKCYYFIVFALLLHTCSSNCQNEFNVKDCLLPHTEPGVACKAYIIRYHWNQTMGKCEKVTYGGCRATRNNFFTMEDCQKIAQPLCQNKTETSSAGGVE